MTKAPGRYVTYLPQAFFWLRLSFGGLWAAMYYANIKYCDIADGVGVRTTLFVSGCRVRCPGCFNSEAWDFCAGEPFDDTVAEKIWKSLESPWVDGLTILGGEPFEPENQAGLRPFLEETRRRFPAKGIWCFSGYLYDRDLLSADGHKHTDDTDAMLSCIDVLVDGPYVADQRDVTLRFRGSSNQRLIDLAAMRKANDLHTIILWQDEKIYSTRGQL